MRIVVPMAGKGSRFRDAGYTLPKPLIPALGKPLYAWAVDSLPLDYASQLIFVLLREEPYLQQIEIDIFERYRDRNTTILHVDKVTAGQSITVLRAKEIIDDEDSLLIHNSDTGFVIEPGWIRKVEHKTVDGALLVFPSDEKRWSYSRESSNGKVAEVREKEVVSPWASTGTYYFRKGHDFVRLAESSYRSNRVESGEYYIGPLYNDLIKEGGAVINVPIDKLLCFGTPQDLDATLRTLQNGN